MIEKKARLWIGKVTFLVCEIELLVAVGLAYLIYRNIKIFIIALFCTGVNMSFYWFFTFGDSK